MKILKRVLSLSAAAVISLAMLASCSSGKYALKIGDRIITPEKYRTAAMSIKTQFLTNNNIEETDDLWDKYVDESYSSTMQEYLDSMVQSYLITYNLYAIHFDELGLKLSDDVINNIKSTMENYVAQYGSKEALDTSLREQGYTYDDFESQYYDEAKKSAVIMYYFGPDSTKNPVSRDQLKSYYEEYYTKVKHVFLSTKDSESNELSNDEKDKIGQKAQEIYQKAMDGADFDELIKEYNEDPGMANNPSGYVFSKEDTTYTRAFYNAAFDMKPGEIRLVQSNLGYHIMKRYAFEDSEIFSSDMETTLIENMMSEETADMLDDLKERIGVKYNNSVLNELSVKNLPAVGKTQDTNTAITDQIKDQLDLDNNAE